MAYTSLQGGGALESLCGRQEHHIIFAPNLPAHASDIWATLQQVCTARSEFVQAAVRSAITIAIKAECDEIYNPDDETKIYCLYCVNLR